MTSLDEMKARSIRRIKGPTILLGSGGYFDFQDPEGSPLDIDDVAYGLAYACRFAGQCWSRVLQRRVFYSVAQHCVLMSQEAPPHLAFDALMHELGEATCGDVTGPLKSLCPDYKAVEKRCERAALGRFRVPMSDSDAIKLLDLRMLATERRDLMRWGGEEWDWTAGAEPFPGEIIPYAHPDDGAAAFLYRYRELSPRHAL